MIYRAISNRITNYARAKSAWQEFWAILRSLNRRAELGRLVAWATRKQLPGPREFYQSRLLDEEIRMSRHVIVSPRFVVELVQTFAINGR